MANLHLITVTAVNSTTIEASFSENINGNIETSNVSIQSQLNGIANATVLGVSISGNTLTIICQPLVPLVSYFVIFQSTPEVPFNSLNGDAVLYQAGETNQFLILGPIEQENPIQTFLISYLRNQIYDQVTNPTSVIGSIIQAFSHVLSNALYSIRQVKNENYLNFIVNDEQKIRGSGPFDRLNEETAYKILRVGKTPTNTIFPLTLNFDIFPNNPVSLLSSSASEILIPSSGSAPGQFNINDLTITVSNINVSILSSVVFTYLDNTPDFTYPISVLGYQILDSTYDQSSAFSFAILSNNQFRLSATILNNPAFSIENIHQVQVSYQYRDLGRIIEQDSVLVSTILSSAREILPPLENIFNLRHIPTDNLGNLGSVGDVIFIDPNAYPPSAKHPAFINEIVFNFAALPSNAGDYAIDYINGTVYVFGQDVTNSGTGATPPLATYSYRYNYVSEIDFVYDDTTNNLVALPNGSLLNNVGNVNFNYEQVLIPGVDYIANLHTEVLSEFLGNRLLASNTLRVNNGPVTNVFRIFNQSTGEIYNVTRFFNDKIYFSFNTPPNIISTSHERVTFASSPNQILFVNNTINTNGIKIFKCLLSNNNLISSTEDSIGSSIDSFVNFSEANIFINEKWFDFNEVEQNNIDRLIIGQYMIDYANGIVYVAVNDLQGIGIGTISYKTSSIVPINKHIISIEDIYYQVNFNNPKNKQFTYSSFGDGFVIPSSFDPSDEAYLNGNLTSPYLVVDNKVGSFVGVIFYPYVTNSIKFIRGLFEFNDLKNNLFPINFAEAATFSDKTITINSLTGLQHTTVQHNNIDGYYVLLNQNISYLSNDITFHFSVIRNSDMVNLWSISGTIVPGSPLKLILSGYGSPNINDAVTINYSFTINNISRVIVNYNKGELYLDYTYLADEIIVSYEYGDNYLDFSQSLSLSAGEQYFASYNVGALRDALQNNFGSLINIAELDQFEVNFNRERYRDALSAALSSFLQGPTIDAIKNIGKTISHIEPEITESAFVNWSLGSSLLNPKGISTAGAFNLVPAKYGTGAVINIPGQIISLPYNSNFKIGEGTFETWIIPEWNGIDNDAKLQISILKDGYSFKSDLVFIGAAEYHPEYQNDIFSISKGDNISGVPNKNKDGVFVYYAPDPIGPFNRFFIDIVDGYSNVSDDGYTKYIVSILIDGVFYDAKPSSNSVSITSGTNKLIFSLNARAPFLSTPFDQGISFVADREHYLLDVGQDPNKNRISLFKDAGGYLNFRAVDRQKNASIVSGDISAWQAGEKHHVAASWILNSINGRDEIHLFLDGFEVPNLIRYGTPILPYSGEKYRTVNPEEIIGQISQNIIGSVDLITTAGSNLVSSSLNFTAYGILPGGIIYIEETGFSLNGYLITNVNGQTLTLSVSMPLSITSGLFSVNKQSFLMKTPIDIYPNISVSKIDGYSNRVELHGIRALRPDYSISDDGYFNPILTITNGVNVNDLILVNTLGLNNKKVNKMVYQWGNRSNVLQTFLPPPVSLNEVNVRHVLLQSLLINKLNTAQSGLSFSFFSDGYDGYSVFDQPQFADLISSGVEASLSASAGTVTLTNGQDLIPQLITGKVTITSAVNPANNGTFAISSYLSPNSITYTNLLAPDGNDYGIGGNASSPAVHFSCNLFNIGRTLAITISGENLNFNFPNTVIITIIGISASNPVSENITFIEAGTKNTLTKFEQILSISATGVIFSINRPYMVLKIIEAFPITRPENNTLNYPVIRFSYQTRAGNSLQGASGNIVTDGYGFFSTEDINNYLMIFSPASVAGTYQILNISPDHLSITIDTSLPTFIGGSYQILNTSTFRSGFQNGFFIFESNSLPGIPYNLAQGAYEFDYIAYLSIKMDPTNSSLYLGSDLFGKNLLFGIIDETKITNNILTDTRIGEIISAKQESITKDYNSLKELSVNSNTLVLCHYDSLPLKNSAKFYATSDNDFIRSNLTVNDNFDGSVVLYNKPVIIDNSGVLNNGSGTIEFWINPKFDTNNDPNYRFYFDATSSIIENVVSTDEITISVAGIIGQIISIKVRDGDNNIDYSTGSRIEIGALDAIVEDTISLSSSSVRVSRPILQIVTVKISGDTTNTDYFANGNIGTDNQTIFLGKQLPNNNLSLIVTYKTTNGTTKTINKQVIRLKIPLPYPTSNVSVIYIPSGTQGDRISIFKDPFGFVNFNVHASGFDHLVRAPAFWSQDTWHRVRASYQFNSGFGNDFLRLFIDGYEHENLLFGSGILFGGPYVFGETFAGSGSFSTIPFKDAINELYLGSDYTEKNNGFVLMSNCRFSDIARPVFAPFGESIDVNFNQNLLAALPVTVDLYTTMLLNFTAETSLISDFAMLIDKNGSNFDFLITIIDSFDIVSASPIVKQTLEALLNALRPATSRMFIEYTQ